MVRVRGVVIGAALMLFAACAGERATITGSYGLGVIQGRVVVTGMENASPAGVEVAVRGTGMSMITNADGAFVFSGAPSDAELLFRRGDGIEASLAVGDEPGFLVVEVSSNAARKSSRRRPSSGTTRKSYEFEGLVESASATELVVFTSHQRSETFVLDAQTVIRKGQTTVSASELIAGTRVHVKASKADDVYTAVLVIVQNAAEDEDGEDDRADVRQYEGVVRRASATELVIFTSHKREETFVLTAATVIRKGNTPVAATDLGEGDRVHVKASTASDGTKTALLVIVQKMR